MSCLCFIGTRKQKILEERKLMQQKERARTVLETMDTVDIESNSDEDSAVQPAPAALELAISRIESGEAPRPRPS